MHSYTSFFFILYYLSKGRLYRHQFHVLQHCVISFRFWYVYQYLSYLFVIQSRVLHLGLSLCFFPFILPSIISFDNVSPRITWPVHTHTQLSNQSAVYTHSFSQQMLSSAACACAVFVISTQILHIYIYLTHPLTAPPPEFCDNVQQGETRMIGRRGVGQSSMIRAEVSLQYQLMSDTDGLKSHSHYSQPLDACKKSINFSMRNQK